MNTERLNEIKKKYEDVNDWADVNRKFHGHYTQKVILEMVEEIKELLKEVEKLQNEKDKK